MNEYVLSLNDNTLDVPVPIYPCGTDISAVIGSGATVTYEIDLGNLIGAVSWNLNTAEITNFSVSWNGVVVDSGATVAATTEIITFNKSASSPSIATITLENTGTAASTTILEPNCVVPDTLTVVQVVIASSTGGPMRYLYSMYDWALGAVNSGYVPSSGLYSTWTTPLTQSGSGYDMPVVNWQSNTYNLGQNGAPLDGSTVYMYSRGEDFPMDNGTSIPASQFRFDPYTNTFSFLRTATAYTPAQALVLLAASTTIATPYERWDSAGAPANWTNTTTTDALEPQYRADFTMPATGQEYLYLIWDLRLTITDDLLCYSNVNLFAICCECSCGPGVCTKYRIINNNPSATATYTYTNCSGVGSTEVVFPATPTTPFVEICSSSVLATTATTAVQNNIVITAEACGLPCP